MADSKVQPLSDGDVDAYRCAPIVLDTIRRQTAAAAGDPVRVLDFGCGRGVLVAWLRRQGIDAWGVDPIRLYVDNGLSYFHRQADAPDEVLTVLADDGRAGFADQTFDVIVSQDVCEHVRDLDRFAAETARLLKPGGIALHVLPARWHPIETHVGVPFIHWLPKGPHRKRLIRSWLRLRRLFGRADGTDVDTETQEIYDYLDSSTHYRTRRTLMRVFAANGFRCDWLGATLRKAHLARPQAAAVIVRIGPLAYLLAAAFSSLRRLQFYCTPAAGPTHPAGAGSP